MTVLCKRVLGVMSRRATYFLGMLMTCAEVPGDVPPTSTLRKNTGDTFQCCPFSVITVTDLRLYLAELLSNLVYAG